MKENLYLIDTDILIFIIKKNAVVYPKCIEYQEKYGNLIISELTYYECLRGYKAEKSDKKLNFFMELVNQFTIIPLTKDIYNSASDIYNRLREKGTPTGEFDILIAATALVNNFRLNTNNEKHYLNIKHRFGLIVDNWMK